MSIHDRGFASMSPARRSEISRLGGAAAHKAGTAHQWTREEARRAGAKGGNTKRDNKAAKSNATIPGVNE